MSTTNTGEISVIILDDDRDFLEGIAGFLRFYQNISVVGLFVNGFQALEWLQLNEVDVVLCDVRMPEMSGLEFLEEAKLRDFPSKIVAMTALETGNLMVQMMSAGACGYILKNSPPSLYATAIFEAMNGGTVVSPQAATILKEYLVQTAQGAQSQGLTVREQEVLFLLHSGKENAEIARALGISQSTVKKVITRLLKKYDVTSRLKLVAFTKYGSDPWKVDTGDLIKKQTSGEQNPEPQTPQAPHNHTKNASDSWVPGTPPDGTPTGWKTSWNPAAPPASTQH